MRIKTPVIERRAAARASIAIAMVAGALCSSATTAAAQTRPWTPPKWFPPVWRQALSIPLPGLKTYPIPGVGTTPPSIITQGETDYLDPAGTIGGYFTGSTIRNPASYNAFFQSLGTNGRTCFSCHQPASGMSISTSALQAHIFLNLRPRSGVRSRWTERIVRVRPYNHSLLLEKGLFRIFLPMPANPEFTLTVVSDPTGCNTNSKYNMVDIPRISRCRSSLSIAAHALRPICLSHTRLALTSQLMDRPPVSLDRAV